MSLLELLGFKTQNAPAAAGRSEPAAVHEIAARVARLGPERARLLGAFAVVLARVARADLEVSEEERGAMARLLVEHEGLGSEEAGLVADLAVELGSSTDDYLATRQLRDLADDELKKQLLHCLMAVSAADDSVTVVEEEEVRQIASELGLSHADFVAARSEFADQREVLRGLSRQR